MTSRLGRFTGWAVVVSIAVAITTLAGAATQPRRLPKPPVAARDSAANDSVPARPRFDGTWKLDPSRSEFGTIPGGRPNARTDVIVQERSRIRQTLYLLNGVRHDTTVYVYSLAGDPTVNQVDGRDIRSVVRWEGRRLHLVSTTKLLVFDMSLDERWDLSADGRTLTMTRHVKHPMGEGDQRLTFERQ